MAKAKGNSSFRPMDGERRRLGHLDPMELLKTAVVVRLQGHKGVWFMFHPSTDHTVVNRVATALSEHTPPFVFRDKTDGVVELYHNGHGRKERSFGVSLDPDDAQVKALLDQRFHDDETPLVHDRIGGDHLPALPAEEATRQLFDYFQTHRKPPVRGLGG